MHELAVHEKYCTGVHVSCAVWQVLTCCRASSCCWQCPRMAAGSMDSTDHVRYLAGVVGCHFLFVPANKHQPSCARGGLHVRQVAALQLTLLQLVCLFVLPTQHSSFCAVSQTALGVSCMCRSWVVVEGA